MKGCDMIANLNRLPEYRLPPEYKVKRVAPMDKDAVLEFIETNFTKKWANEAEHAIHQDKCFIVTEAGKLLGFACYDATAKGFFGPIGVAEEKRGQGIGEALLLRTLTAMREFGYGYAIIGWVDEAEMFYRKTVQAEFIPGGEPENSVYSNMIGM